MLDENIPPVSDNENELDDLNAVGNNVVHESYVPIVGRIETS